MDTAQLVGKPEADAVREIEAAGFVARVKRRDVQPQRGDNAVNKNRINLHIENGMVTKAYIG